MSGTTGMIIAQAEESIEVKKQDSQIYINPLYEGIITEADLESQLEQQEAENEGLYEAAHGSESNLLSETEAVQAIRDAMVNREYPFSIYIQGDYSSFTAEMNLLSKALEHTGNPKEGDYLAYQYGGYYTPNSELIRDGAAVRGTCISYSLIYYTNATQEAAVDAELQSVMNSLESKWNASTTREQKLNDIYDFICNRTVYGTPDSSINPGNKLQYTAYGALILRKSVCQGYTNLLYRMMLTAGLSGRIVSGEAKSGEKHAWNIVQMDSTNTTTDLYYNLDSTWDATLTHAKQAWQYYLKGSSTFDLTHIREPFHAGTFVIDYTSTAFKTAYPVNSEDHEKASKPAAGGNLQDMSLTQTELTLARGDTAQLIALAIPDSATLGTVTWKSQDESIVTVSNNGIVTAVGPGSTFVYAMEGSKGFRKTCSVTVEVPMTAVLIEPSDLKLQVGESITVSAVLQPEDATFSGDYSWTSSDSSIASVFVPSSGKAKITANKAGEATITLSLGGNSTSCSVTVTGGQGSDPITPGITGFTDVKPGSYYEQPVLWAVQNSITSGTSATTFGPGDPCTRAQAMTFLWKSQGSQWALQTNRFLDVTSDKFYATPIAWAVDRGITSGVSSNLFGSGNPCTRAQIVTFLWKAYGTPMPSVFSGFEDVSESSWYATAVAWAVDKGITSGTGNGKFSPSATCTRSQIVTFLYKAQQ